MHLRSMTLRGLMKVSGILLLWLLSVADGFAATPARAARETCDPQQTTSIRRLVRQAQLVGGPVAKRVRRSLFRVRPRTAHVERTVHRPSATDESQAIQNDAPIAHTAVPPVLALRVLGIFADRLERLPFTPSSSPRSPRGPPAIA